GCGGGAAGAVARVVLRAGELGREQPQHQQRRQDRRKDNTRASFDAAPLDHGRCLLSLEDVGKDLAGAAAPALFTYWTSNRTASSESRARTAARVAGDYGKYETYRTYRTNGTYAAATRVVADPKSHVPWAPF